MAGVLIALENVVPGKFDLLLRQPVVHEKQDNARHTNAERDRMDGFFMGRVSRKITPFVEIERAEGAIFSIDDDLGLSLEKQRQGAPGGADIYGLPQPVQDEHMLI